MRDVRADAEVDQADLARAVDFSLRVKEIEGGQQAEVQAAVGHREVAGAFLVLAHV